MKECPVVGCDVPIHESDVLCRGCLATATPTLRSAYVAAWRHFRYHFDSASRDAYERATRAVIVDAGLRKRPTQMRLDL